MTTTLDRPRTSSNQTALGDASHDNLTSDDAEQTEETLGVRSEGQTLRREMTAVKLSFHWPGTTKSLSPIQKATAADAFGASGKSISAGKKLIDTTHPAWKACTAVRSQCQKFWTGLTLPWPEAGIRLIRRDDVRSFNIRMEELRTELRDAARALDATFEQLKTQAADRLGELFDPSDYPASVANAFLVEWSYPSVEAPDYLRQMCPEIYREEQRRVAAQFEEAVRLAEAAFVEEFSQLVEHLSERLAHGEDGKPKVFRDSAIDNLTEFFTRFGRLNITGSQALERTVADAKRLLSGTNPQELRDLTSVRQSVASGLARVQSSLDGLLVDRPRRRVLRG